MQKGTRTHDPLTQCVDLRADDSNRKAAIVKADGRIIGITSRELAAAEAWYHGQCYRDYTGIDKASKNLDLVSESGSDENK